MEGTLRIHQKFHDHPPYDCPQLTSDSAHHQCESMLTSLSDHFADVHKRFHPNSEKAEFFLRIIKLILTQ